MFKIVYISIKHIAYLHTKWSFHLGILSKHNVFNDFSTYEEQRIFLIPSFTYHSNIRLPLLPQTRGIHFGAFCFDILFFVLAFAFYLLEYWRYINLVLSRLPIYIAYIYSYIFYCLGTVLGLPGTSTFVERRARKTWLDWQTRSWITYLGRYQD
jgi:hypothetical protein